MTTKAMKPNSKKIRRLKRLAIPFVLQGNSKLCVPLVEIVYPYGRACGCYVLGSDGSFIACERHTSYKLKALAESAVPI